MIPSQIPNIKNSHILQQHIKSSLKILTSFMHNFIHHIFKINSVNHRLKNKELKL